MNTRSTINVLLLFALLLPAHAATASLGELRLSLIAGDVQIRTADTSEWSPAVINFPLRDGDQLWVPEEGRAEVETRRGTTIRLDERSALDILTVDNDALQFYLDMGLAYVNASGKRGTTLQIDTPLSSIRVYERAKFGVEVFNDGDTDIPVFMGEVSVESRRGETLVEDGEMLALGENWAEFSPLDRADAWERWNMDRDRSIEGQRRSVRYLPAELAGYSSDFDDNGEWVEVSSYGYVWRPIVQVSIDWSPYRHGRWVWIGDDYVWIARESWGWAPYHYGRWSHIPRYGWCWVPPTRNEVYWGPGYVGWVHTATYVAWVPLAPREVYYGRGYYGSHSVDIRHVDSNRVPVNIVYKNVYVNNSVTTVHNDTFIRGRHVDFKVDKNPFLSKHTRGGRPEIQPERATRRPSMREIPQDKAPPAKIREARIDDLKKQRRLVTKKDKSVFAPQTAPRTMEVEQKKAPRSRAPRKDRLREGDSKTAAPQKREDARPLPAVRESPPEIRQENKQKPQSGARDRGPTRSESDSRTNRGSRQSGRPVEDVQAAPAERESPPASRQENKQKPQSGARDREPTRSEGDSRTNRGSRQSGRPVEEVQAAPAERESPPESRQENKQKPQSGARDREPTRSEGDSRTNRGSRQSGGPVEDVQAAPAERESPPASRQENKQRPQPGTRDREPTRSESDSRTNRGSRQAADSKEEARTTPAVTKEGTKAERPTLKPEQKKKVKKELSPEELEKLSPEELEKLSHEEDGKVPRERYRK